MKRVRRLLEPGSGRRATLVGGVLGLVSDARLVEDALAAAQPAEVLLGVPFEDLDAIRATIGKEATSEFASQELDEDYLDRLKEFGDVQTPPPDLYAAYRYAETHRLPIRAIDLGDEDYSTLYAKHVGLFEVLRNNRRQRRLPQSEIHAASVDEFALRWDRALYPSRGLRKLQDARESAMASAIHAAPSTSSLALVPLARLDGVAARLLAQGWHEPA